MDTWKIVTKRDELGFGIYQEKMIIIAAEKEMADKLKSLVVKEYPDAEACSVPENILVEYPFSFGYWINKHDTRISMKDIKSGSIRKKL